MNAAESDVGKELLRHLREAKLLQAEEQRSLCVSCQHPVVCQSLHFVQESKDIHSIIVWAVERTFVGKGGA